MVANASFLLTMDDEIFTAAILSKNCMWLSGFETWNKIEERCRKLGILDLVINQNKDAS